MTEKLLARKEGRTGYVTFNNPERHNAMSLEMWESAQQLMVERIAASASWSTPPGPPEQAPQTFGSYGAEPGSPDESSRARGAEPPARSGEG
jgi:hypothetical protein